jgi:tetratricopeptide (TPR) repeat protein
MKQRITTAIVITTFFFIGACQTNKPKEEKNQKIETTDQTGIYGFLCTVGASDAEWYLSDNQSPLFKNLGTLNYPITTNNEKAQEYFNQGLTFAYGFNHAEAARSFYTATKVDPSAAMCYWGYAYVLGPNYNAGMEDDNYKRAYNAIQKAIELSENCTQKEKDIINTMSTRYSKEIPDDRAYLDSTYSIALEELKIKYPDDANIAIWYAESLMDMHPWDLWDKEGQPKKWTPAILTALENAIELDNTNPGGHHLYIHAIEASFEPERGLPSATILDNGLVPGSGHLMHMPSHVYIRTGDYHKGSLANLRAVAADSVYISQTHADGAYPLAYYPHNYHFLSATATLEGNSKLALYAAGVTSKLAHPKLMKEKGWSTLQHFYVIPYFVMVKFGKWQQILNIPEETVELVYPRAIRHYARGMAYAGLDDLDKASYELKLLRDLSEDEAIKNITIWDINPASSLINIAIKVLEGEIEYKNKNYEQAIKLYSEAIKIEDALNYDEPPVWFFSVRHYLGVAQIKAEKFEDAIKTYQEDLHNFPDNGWALHGLLVCYRDTDNEETMIKTYKKFFKVWEHSDVGLFHSKVY